MTYIFGVLSLALMTFLVFVAREIHGQARSIVSDRAPETRYNDSEIRGHLARIDSQMADLLQAVAQGIQHVERSERRVKSTLQRTRQKLRENGMEDAAVEAEFSELRDVDGGGSEPEPMPAVSTEMGNGAYSSVEGVTSEQLMRARGFR